MKNRFRKVANPYLPFGPQPAQPALSFGETNFPTPPEVDYQSILDQLSPNVEPDPWMPKLQYGAEGLNLAENPDQLGGVPDYLRGGDPLPWYHGIQNLPWNYIAPGALGLGGLGGLVGGKRGALLGAILGGLGGYGYDKYLGQTA